MYSPMFLPGMTLTNETIKTLFEHEVMTICKPKTYMGIWQLFALGSVLKMPIFSVYPNLGDSIVRKDLHRLIKPRIQECDHVAHVLWTSTRTDMRPSSWCPNHFVPMLHIESTLKNSGERVSCSSEICHESKEIQEANEVSITSEMDSETEKVQESSKDNGACKTGGRTDEMRDVSNERQDESILLDVPVPEECLDKYVVVLYDGIAYPGYVEDTTVDEVYVECMHRVGRKPKENNRFFWPQRIKDKCWYEHDQILAIIPQPQKNVGSYHYGVEPALWNAIMAKIK